MIVAMSVLPIIMCSSSNMIYSIDAGLSIKGRVNENNVPIPCRVRLYQKTSGKLIHDVATDDFGKYIFSKLLGGKYFIVAHHPASQFNAVIQDNVVPE